MDIKLYCISVFFYFLAVTEIYKICWLRQLPQIKEPFPGSFKVPDDSSDDSQDDSQEDSSDDSQDDSSDDEIINVYRPGFDSSDSEESDSGKSKESKESSRTLAQHPINFKQVRFLPFNHSFSTTEIIIVGRHIG